MSRVWSARGFVAVAFCAACHDGDSDGTGGGPTPAPLVVTSIAPIPYLGYRETPFTITGSGFLRETSGGGQPIGPSGINTGVAGGTLGEVTVTFRTDDGTPFADGTSATAQVVGTVISDTEIQGTSPITNATGIWPVSIEVTDALGSAASATPVAAFAGLTVFNIDTADIPADAATPVRVLGLSFPPALGTCTVRFTAVSPATFPGGGATLDVPGTIDNLIFVSATTPVVATTSTIPAYVSVILDGEPGTPQATSSSVLTEFVPPPLVPVVVSQVSVPVTPIPIAEATAFEIAGSGFGGGNATVSVTFTAPGAPFGSGSTVSATVPGTAISDTAVTGTSPTGTATTTFDAFVTIARGDGVEGTSATEIASFSIPAAALVTGLAGFTPNAVRANTATAFTIAGTNLPPPPASVTVRFRAIEGTPFNGGTSETADVTANVTSTTSLAGTTPLATTTTSFLSEVTVILPTNELLPLGVVCAFLQPSPAPTTTRQVTNLNDSGPGSLRQTILDAVPECVITFSPSLSGNIDLASTIEITESVHILGPGPDVIRVTAQDNDYPVFTIAAAATETLIEQLSVRSSHHSGDGGGFLVRGGLTLVRCELADHAVDGAGGGVHVADGATAILKECTVRDSTADDRGGGAFATSGGTLQIVACTFSDNSCGAGGGAIATEPGANVQVANSTLFRNTSTGGPGGGALLIAPNSTLSLLHCTLSENSGHNRGGAAFIQGTLNATNCIFARNSDGKGEPEISNQNGTNNTTFSLVRVGNGSGLANGSNGNLVGTSENPVEAELGSIQQNGGPTRTMSLKPNSPALNVGTASQATKDQRGENRPQGSGPDMGSYESTVN